ncbi:trimeric intracellular cation channel family protein [Dokdonia sinensis]|uniref:Trimeric intracellular cation channel family protein n=1 Tax=Dokdonia sinensis TaxID=2479847 RepID=A0A3M0GG01_9FLAO|nr:trimeric intracellular cation channel family protein [Dokdonia sinensis]RMB64021.1 trimeric intracellular cation channel family protein [Dokdonia sinensis]
MDFLTIIDILGTISFAISGVLTAMNKRMDVFGILIIAAVTSVGGGTLRDVLIGKTPVTWMLNMTFIYVILGATIAAIVFRPQLKYVRKSLFLFDTIGIGLYTTAGVQIGLAADLHPIICILLGTMSACFGGVLRDILCNEIPVIFRKEIYATACILGGVVYLILYRFDVDTSLTTIIAGSVVITVRLLAVHFKLSLPSVYRDAAMPE